VVLAVAILLPLLLGGVALASGVYDIPWSVVGGGGGHSAAAGYVLDATAGQAVAGVVADPALELCAGFWCPEQRYEVYLPLVLR
jgi:hypothetical protein